MEYIDTRDLVKRAGELEEEQETLENEQEMNPTQGRGQEIEEIEEIGIELGEIEGVKDACEDFEHGATLIPEDDFERYAQEFAEDIGAINSEMSWPLGCIDWERAARELAMDYTTVSYQGTDYYIR